MAAPPALSLPQLGRAYLQVRAKKVADDRKAMERRLRRLAPWKRRLSRAGTVVDTPSAAAQSWGMAAAAFTPASDEEVSAAAAAVAGPSSLAEDLGASSASDLQETQAEAMKLDKEMRKLQRDRKKLNSRIIRQKGSLDDLKSRIADLRKQSAPCTGIAFVTFNEQSSAHACRDMLKAATEPMRLPKSRQELHLRAEFAPHPDNVLWENLQIRGRERQLRSGIVWAIISLMMCVSRRRAIRRNYCGIIGQFAPRTSLPFTGASRRLRSCRW